MLNSLGSTTNPLDTDLGLTQLNMMIPSTRMVGYDYLPGVTDSMKGITMNNGQLPCDTVDIDGNPKRNRRKNISIYTKALLGIAGLVATGFALKKGKDGVVKLWKSLMEKLGFAKKSKK